MAYGLAAWSRLETNWQQEGLQRGADGPPRYAGKVKTDIPGELSAKPPRRGFATGDMTRPVTRASASLFPQAARPDAFTHKWPWSGDGLPLGSLIPGPAEGPACT